MDGLVFPFLLLPWRVFMISGKLLFWSVTEIAMFHFYVVLVSWWATKSPMLWKCFDLCYKFCYIFYSNIIYSLVSPKLWWQYYDKWRWQFADCQYFFAFSQSRWCYQSMQIHNWSFYPALFWTWILSFDNLPDDEPNHYERYEQNASSNRNNYHSFQVALEISHGSLVGSSLYSEFFHQNSDDDQDADCNSHNNPTITGNLLNTKENYLTKSSSSLMRWYVALFVAISQWSTRSRIFHW